MGPNAKTGRSLCSLYSQAKTLVDRDNELLGSICTASQAATGQEEEAKL